MLFPQIAEIDADKIISAYIREICERCIDMFLESTENKNGHPFRDDHF